MSKTRKNTRQWTELTEEKENFQRILRLLILEDEEKERPVKTGDWQNHYMRKAIAWGDAEGLRVFIRALGGFIYYVVAELHTTAGFVSSGWVHEDGIKAQRELREKYPYHPVHVITCMTDIYENHCEVLEFEESCLDISTMDLLDDEIYDRWAPPLPSDRKKTEVVKKVKTTGTEG